MITILIVMWVLPTIVALAKGCDSKGSIILISLLFGWFPLVSLFCLIWAICGSTRRKQVRSAKILAEAIVKAQRT